MTSFVLGLAAALMLTLASCSATSDDDAGDAGVTVPSDLGGDVPSVETDASASCVDERNWTPGGDGDAADYVDFVQLEDGHFVHAQQNVGVLDEPDLGDLVAEVCLELSEVTFRGPFDIAPGDAAYLPVGTKLREIVGADPSLRIGTVLDGKVLIYEVSDPPDAVVGGQMIDLGVNVDEISVKQAGGETVITSITEPDAIEGLVVAVRTAPVDRSPRSDPEAGNPGYVLEFHRSDGTTTRRPYRPSNGELASVIMLPEEARLLLVGLITEADPEVAAATTSTTATTAPTTSSTNASTTADTGLIPEPVNEAEAGLHFDFGAIVGTSITADGDWIQFDRYQLADGTNGTELTAEVRIEGATDLGWANENTRFRWYPLAADVEILELEADWFSRLCDRFEDDVAFVPSSLNRLLTLDARLVSLTLKNREVVRIRDQRSC